MELRSTFFPLVSTKSKEVGHYEKGLQRLPDLSKIEN